MRNLARRLSRVVCAYPLRDTDAMPEPIERTFLGWDRPALPAAAALLIDHYGAGDEVQLGDVVVALPGGRAGRRLKELLIEEAERRDARLIPPHVTTVGHVPELIYPPSSPLADPVLRHRVWAHALAALPTDSLRRVFPIPPDPGDLSRWAALAAEVDRLHRELSGAGLRFGDVAARCREGLLFDDSERWAGLAAAQRHYAEALRSLGRMDVELARFDALARPPEPPHLEVWLLGVVEMPEVVRRILCSAADAGLTLRSLVHAPDDRADAFDEVGCVRAEAWLEAEPPLSDALLRVCDNPVDQAETALSDIAALDGAFAADEIVVGVPDDEVVPYLEECLAGAGLPVRRGRGIPLHRTRPFRLLQGFADYLDGGRYDAFAALLRHPDVPRWLRRAAGDERAPVLTAADVAVIEADRYFSGHLPVSATGRLGGGPGARRGVETVRAALADRRLLGRLQGRNALSSWAAEIMDVLVEIYGHQPLDRDAPADRRLIQACDVLRNAAAGFHWLPTDVDTPCDAATAIRLLLDEVRSEEIPPEPDRAAIELLGWLELHLDDAPAAVVTGLNEPHLPQTVNADPYLPNALRARLGLVDNERRYARDNYLLTAMLNSRGRITLTAGRHDAAGDPLRPSRLMLATQGEALAERILRFYEPDTDEHSGREVGDEAAADTSAAQAAPASLGASGPEQYDMFESMGAAGADAAAESESMGPAGADAAAEFESMGPAGADTAAESESMEPAGADAAAEPETVPSAPEAAFPHGVSRFRLPPERQIHTDEPIRELRVTDFARLLQDPYRFALERVLRLRPLDDEARELDGAGFGALAHAVLGAFGLSEEANVADQNAVTERLDALLDGMVHDRFRRNALPAVRIQIEQLRARLHAFAEWHASWIEGGWRVRAVEGQLLDARQDSAAASHGFVLDVDGEPVTITGRIDRIDHHPQRGEWAVFDYKTSELPREPEAAHRRRHQGETIWVDLQLPLYRHIVAAIRDPGGERLVPDDAAARLRLGYILLPRQRERVRAYFASWSADELKQADEAARSAVRIARTGVFAYDPAHVITFAWDPLATLLGRFQLTADATDGAERQT